MGIKTQDHLWRDKSLTNCVAQHRGGNLGPVLRSPTMGSSPNSVGPSHANGPRTGPRPGPKSLEKYQKNP